jgi:hypothetical protein
MANKVGDLLAHAANHFLVRTIVASDLQDGFSASLGGSARADGDRGRP